MLAIVAGRMLLSRPGGLAGSGTSAGNLIGPAAVAAACLAWAVDNNLTQKVSAGDPVQITMVKGHVAGTTNTALALALGACSMGGPEQQPAD